MSNFPTAGIFTPIYKKYIYILRISPVMYTCLESPKIKLSHDLKITIVSFRNKKLVSFVFFFFHFYLDFFILFFFMLIWFFSSHPTTIAPLLAKSLLKKWSFPLGVFSVIVTRSTGNCGFANLVTFTEEILNGNKVFPFHLRI